MSRRTSQLRRRFLAAVRRAGEREFLVDRAEHIGRAARHPWQRLQDLDGRAREDRLVDVADRSHPATFGIDHGSGPGMRRFERATAQHVEEDGLRLVDSCAARR